MDNKSTGSPASEHDRSWMNTSLSPDERTALVLAQLTLEEKISMVHGISNDAYAMAAIARLGIPALTMTDGPAGVNEGQATSLPAPIGLAATWDLAAVDLLPGPPLVPSSVLTPRAPGQARTSHRPYEVSPCNDNPVCVVMKL